ncbi:MAG: hypothetical protein MZV63_64205 [Marinilabiliales bacterium]|nr:hypothetical protein [Marinilabiliales bacterium]
MRIILIITVMAVHGRHGRMRQRPEKQDRAGRARTRCHPRCAVTGRGNPEVAPFGNAALAGKPGEEDEAATHVWDFRDATTWLLGDILLARFLDPPHSSWYVSGYRDYQPGPGVHGRTEGVQISVI